MAQRTLIDIFIPSIEIIVVNTQCSCIILHLIRTLKNTSAKQVVMHIKQHFAFLGNFDIQTKIVNSE